MSRTPKMTRQDFQFIADVLLESREIVGDEPAYQRPNFVIDLLCKRFASALKSTNSAFLRGRFLEACGVVDQDQAYQTDKAAAKAESQTMTKEWWARQRGGVGHKQCPGCVNCGRGQSDR